jgi:hypothetical protein
MFSDPAFQDALVGVLIAFMGFLAVLLSILTPKLATWLNAMGDQATTEGHAASVDLAKALAQSAVLWVEQSMQGVSGQQKKEFATQWLEETAERVGIELDPANARRLVEEAVRLMQGAGLNVEATEAQRARDAQGRFVKKGTTSGTPNQSRARRPEAAGGSAEGSGSNAIGRPGPEPGTVVPF